jgi:hypothetical protein
MGPALYMPPVVDRKVVMRRLTKWQKLWPHIIRRNACALRLAVPSVRMEQAINYIRRRSGQELAAFCCPGNRILAPNMKLYTVYKKDCTLFYFFF